MRQANLMIRDMQLNDHDSSRATHFDRQGCNYLLRYIAMESIRLFQSYCRRRLHSDHILWEQC